MSFVTVSRSILVTDSSPHATYDLWGPMNFFINGQNFHETNCKNLNMTKLMLFLATFLSQNILSVSAADDGCVAECAPFGYCVKKVSTCTGFQCEMVCKCNPNYIGADCSIPVEVCPGSVNPDGSARTCFNGGRCTLSPAFVADLEYWCDCRTATGNAKAYAGHQCEFPHKESCELGAQESSYAFCVNDGSCARQVKSGEPHPGCFCGEKYEGQHCQYKKGDAPSFELANLPQILPEEDGMSTGVVVLIVFAVLAVITGGIWFFTKRSLRSSDKVIEYDHRDVVVNNDLQMLEDEDSDIVDVPMTDAELI